MQAVRWSFRAWALALGFMLAAALPAGADFEAGQRALDAGRPADAVAAWQSAAEAGDGRSMLALGRAYAKGLGALQDFVEAHRWLNLAAGLGSAEAAAERDALAGKMTADERAKVRKLTQARPAGTPQRQAKQACDDVWSGCPGEEYWNRELQEKAARLDPWADYREAEERAAGGEEDRTEAADRRERGGARACEDDWAGCPGTTGFAGADEGRGGTVESYPPEAPRYPDASTGGAYAAALAGLANESGASSGYGSATSAGGYRAALDRMEKEEADRRRREREAELRREREEAEREEAERARRQAALDRMEKEEADRRRREREAELRREREEAERARRRAQASARDRTCSSSSNTRSSSSGLFGSSTSSGSGGLFKADSGLQALRDIRARREAEQRQYAERVRRQQEELRRQQQAAQRRQDLERQRQQAAYERRQEQQRQAEARRQRQAREQQQAEARRQRQIREQRQAEARRLQKEQRKRQETARLRREANAATAAHCLKSRQQKGGFNVADVQIGNSCGFSINVSGACRGTSFTANYPYEGT